MRYSLRSNKAQAPGGRSLSGNFIFGQAGQRQQISAPSQIGLSQYLRPLPHLPKVALIPASEAGAEAAKPAPSEKSLSRDSRHPPPLRLLSARLTEIESLITECENSNPQGQAVRQKKAHHLPLLPAPTFPQP
jgi:hypothetical protein